MRGPGLCVYGHMSCAAGSGGAVLGCLFCRGVVHRQVSFTSNGRLHYLTCARVLVSQAAHASGHERHRGII